MMLLLKLKTKKVIKKRYATLLKHNEGNVIDIIQIEAKIV
jgi:hypothetical protein